MIGSERMWEMERRARAFIGEYLCGALLLETADNQSYDLGMSPTR
jgi:hypothetical protein